MSLFHAVCNGMWNVSIDMLACNIKLCMFCLIVLKLVFSGEFILVSHISMEYNTISCVNGN